MRPKEKVTGLKSEGLIPGQGSLIKGYIVPAAVILVCIAVLEVFVFNFRHWQSLNNDPVTAEYTYSESLTAEDVNAFRIGSADDPVYLEISDIDLDIENIALDITFPELGVTAVETVKYHLEIIDEGNRNRYALPGMEFLHLVPQSHYDYLDLYGNARNIRVCLDEPVEGRLFRVEYLILNSIVPLMISKKRMLALFVFAYMLFCLRPSGSLYRYRAGDSVKLRRTGVILILLAEIVASWWVINLNEAFRTPLKDGERQFALLAEALAQGETHLLYEPPEALLNMEDPYDHMERMRVCTGEEEALWDTAYYKGHYYVYFGVGPIITYYLPYYLITGRHISTLIVVFINIVLTLAAVPFLLCELMDRFFKEIPLSVYFMMVVLMSFGTGILYLLMKPDFYAVPLAMAMALCFWGLGFWLSSVKNGGVVWNRLLLGSLFMAAEAAVRPQFLLASFLALLIFRNAVFKKRELFSKKGLAATLSFVVPYIVMAALVMYYNYDRFGSVFDFGANYNLTNNNMPYRGFHLDRLLNGVIGFMFMPCNVTNRFPYFNLSAFRTAYQGPTGDEILLGGLIYNHPFLIITLLPFLFKKYIEDKRLYLYTLAAPVAAMIVMFVDANMAGVIMRYNSDFAWYLMISFIIMVCSLICRLNAVIGSTADRESDMLTDTVGTVQRILYLLLNVIFALFIIRCFLYIFTGDGYPKINLKLVWHTAEHLVEFWH